MSSVKENLYDGQHSDEAKHSDEAMTTFDLPVAPPAIVDNPLNAIEMLHYATVTAPVSMTAPATTLACAPPKTATALATASATKPETKLEAKLEAKADSGICEEHDEPKVKGEKWATVQIPAHVPFYGGYLRIETTARSPPALLKWIVDPPNIVLRDFERNLLEEKLRFLKMG